MIAGMTTLVGAVAALERSVADHPAAAAAGSAATGLYVNGLVSAALAVFEQSRHLDKPYFATSPVIDGRPGLYNPDTRYSAALLAGGAGEYLITGRRGGHALLSLQILDRYPIVGLGRSLAVIDLDSHGIGPGDDFEIRLGGTQQVGDLWVPLAKDARAVLARQTFVDWVTESASTLVIERLDLGAPAIDSASGFRTVADFIDGTDRTWNAGYLAMLQQLPVNEIGVPRASDTGAGGLGGQFSTAGRYRIGPRQALIVTVPRSAAIYQGIQLGNPWYVTPNYADHQVSLNSGQAVADPDGLLRFVISLVDPGVANWLDPAGFAEGYCWLRWQGADELPGENQAPGADLVDLADLARVLPAQTRTVTPAERAEQLATRTRPPLRQ